MYKNMSSARKGSRRKKKQDWHPESPIDTYSKMSSYISKCSKWLKTKIDQQQQNVIYDDCYMLPQLPATVNSNPQYILDKKSYLYFPTSTHIQITCPFCNTIIQDEKNTECLLNAYTRQHWTPVCNKCLIKQEF